MTDFVQRVARLERKLERAQRDLDLARGDIAQMQMINSDLQLLADSLGARIEWLADLDLRAGEVPRG